MMRKTYLVIICMAVFAMAYTSVSAAGISQSDKTIMRTHIVNALTYDKSKDFSEGVRAETNRIKASGENYKNQIKIENGTWIGLGDSPSAINNEFSKVLVIATASNLKNGEWNQDVRNMISALCKSGYNGNIDKTDSEWWYYEIGIPLSLTKSLLLTESAYTREEIEKYCETICGFCPEIGSSNTDGWKESGANRTWKAEVLFYCGLLLDNEKGDKLIAHAIEALSDVFNTVKKYDGFYADGSFIQHGRVPYTGAYGKFLLESAALIAYAVDGTQLQLGADKKGRMLDWALNSFEPLMQNGAVMAMVRGRAIARYYETDHSSGHNIIDSLAKVAEITESSELRGCIKNHVVNDKCGKFSCSAFGRQVIDEIIADNGIGITESSDSVHVFSSMDRAVFSRGGFKFGIAMSSQRIYNYEADNGENMRGWHTGSGMTYLYGQDSENYDKGFWCTVDPYRLSGTTVDNTEYQNEDGYYYQSSEAWCGGSELDGKYGAAGMSIKKPCGTELSGKKSWFCIGDEIIAMGAGITNSDKTKETFTVIENKITDGDEIKINGNDFQQSGDFYNTYWINTDDKDGNKTGYFFPMRDKLSIKSETREGNWRDIHAASDRTEQNTFFSVVKKHGIGANNAEYVYVLLPGKNAGETQAYARTYMTAPQFELMENSSNVQAVKNKNVTAANFWKAGTVGGISVNHEASVIVAEDDANIKISLSDPTQTAGDSIRLVLDKKAAGFSQRDCEIKVISVSPKIIIDVDTSDLQGRSAEITFLKNEIGAYDTIFLDYVYKPDMTTGTVIQGTWQTETGEAICSGQGNNKIKFALDKEMDVQGEETYIIEWDQYAGAEISSSGNLKDLDGQFLSFSDAVLGGGFKRSPAGDIRPFLWWYNTGGFADLTVKQNTWYHMTLIAELHGSRRDKMYLYVTEEGKTASGTPCARLEINGNVKWKECLLFCGGMSEGNAGFRNLRIIKTDPRISEAFSLIESGGVYKDDEAWNMAQTAFGSMDEKIRECAAEIFSASFSKYNNEAVVLIGENYRIVNACSNSKYFSVITQLAENNNIRISKTEIESCTEKDLPKTDGRIFIWESLNTMRPLKCVRLQR
ncbi:MAG: polysaccharide lyase 8 family protein [Clostridia bacterium]|nr:polysaccharide lyase 8 family protein [Clostridia bacterium]